MFNLFMLCLFQSVNANSFHLHKAKIMSQSLALPDHFQVGVQKGGRRHWTINYTGTQSFMETLVGFNPWVLLLNLITIIGDVLEFMAKGLIS